MTAPDQLLIEAAFGEAILDTSGDPILDSLGRAILDGGFADWSSDVLDDAPIRIVCGQRNNEPADRVADPGTLTLVLNNNANNSGGVVGYYSPDSAEKRSGFEKGLQVRLGLVKDSVTYWKFRGRIIEIDPEPGLLNDKTTQVTAADWLDVASRTPMPRLPVQQSVTDDQVIQAIVDAVDDPPASVDLDVGTYTYDYALTDVEDGKNTILAVLQRLTQTGLGRLFVKNNEVLTYVNLTNQLTTGAPAATFDNAFREMKATRRAYKRVKRVTVTVYPMAIDGSPVVLFSLAEELIITAGETIEFVAYFHDPNASSGRTIAAVDVITPVAGTDWNFSSISGSGSDLNGDLSVDAFAIGSKSALIRITNNAAVTGYLWQMQFRGKGLYPYDPLSYTTENSEIKEGEGTTLTYDLPYQNDYYTGRDIADALLTWYELEVTEVPSIKFTPTLDADSFARMLACVPGELITVSEDVTAISYIMIMLGFELDIWLNGQYMEEELFITPAQYAQSGLFEELDVDGQCELDGDNTLLAFG